MSAIKGYKKPEPKNKKIYTTELIDKIENKYNMGYKLSRYEQIYFQNIWGVRKSGIFFAMTREEIEEFIKCKLSIHYFAEQYCHIKLEDGGIGLIHLRDYQKETLEFIQTNRYVINFTSKQMGIGLVHSIYFLWVMLFGDDKIIYTMANKSMSTKELIRRMKDIYKLLPFFLKVGVTNWSEKQIAFENGSKIIGLSRSKDAAIGHKIDIFYIQDFSMIPWCEELFKNIFPTLSSYKDSKFIIHSGQNGFNYFYKLVQDSERPEGDPQKNMFKTLRTYWYQVPGRDQKWVDEQIRMLGSEHRFDEEYRLCFTSEIKEKTYTWVVSNPDLGIVLGPRMDKIYTITNVRGHCMNGYAAVNLYYGSLDSKKTVLDNNLICTSNDTSAFTHVKTEEGDWLILSIIDMEGTVGQVVVTIEGYEMKK